MQKTNVKPQNTMKTSKFAPRTVGERIQSARKAAGLTLDACAVIINTPRGKLSQWEAGEMPCRASAHTYELERAETALETLLRAGKAKGGARQP